MQNVAIFIISFLSIAGVILHPFKIPEATWPLIGGVLLIFFKLITFHFALTGILKGTEVYFFLTGMMLLAEIAREEKLFDWLAVHATVFSRGSSKRLFLIIYIVGILVTIFLSNDATAVVLTPAVAAAIRAARIKKPMPYLLICAFIANAASFVLPISNPANIIFYRDKMPSLIQWLAIYTVPSIFAISSTFFVLRYTQRKHLEESPEIKGHMLTLSRGGKLALLGILATAFILLICSYLNLPLGLITLIAAGMTFLLCTIPTKKNPFLIIKRVTWSVLPLVAGLFIIVEALNSTNTIKNITILIQHYSDHSVFATANITGIVLAIACNLMNNLPTGLLAATALHNAAVPEIIRSAMLIGVDLGPNLSITGSLATILWLIALRREGLVMSGCKFLSIGFWVMFSALFMALGSLWLQNLFGH